MRLNKWTLRGRIHDRNSARSEIHRNKDKQPRADQDLHNTADVVRDRQESDDSVWWDDVPRWSLRPGGWNGLGTGRQVRVNRDVPDCQDELAEMGGDRSW